MKYQKEMGTVVRVEEEYHLRREKAHRWWERCPVKPPRSGWIVGFRTIYNGHVQAGAPRHYGYFGDDYDPPYLKVTQSIPCALIAFTPRSKPIRVPIDAYQPTDKLPRSGMSDMDRNFLRQESRSWPRDEKGRWK